jgi:drug/metabolite transporter (DMT)-like permease
MDPAAILLAFLSAIFMGTIGVFSRVTALPAEVIAFFRLTLGAAFMLVFLGVVGKTHLVRKWPTWPVMLNGCLLAGFIVFYVQAMNFTSMANAIMLVYLAPLAAALVAHFHFGERLTLAGFGLIGLALFGFAMVMEFRLTISAGDTGFLGVSLGFAAMACYAGFIVVNRMISDEVHVYTRTFYLLFVGGLVMAPFLLRRAEEVSRADIAWLMGIGLFPGFLAILFAVVALSRLPAATFGTIAYSEPVAVVIFGWTLFDEALSALQVCGCVLIMLSGILKTLTMASGERLGSARPDARRQEARIQ